MAWSFSRSGAQKLENIAKLAYGFEWLVSSACVGFITGAAVGVKFVSIEQAKELREANMLRMQDKIDCEASILRDKIDYEARISDSRAELTALRTKNDLTERLLDKFQMEYENH
eukprot:Platyproteum_vivax@DN13431_c0_g1_i1.p1